MKQTQAAIVKYLFISKYSEADCIVILSFN